MDRWVILLVFCAIAALSGVNSQKPRPRPGDAGPGDGAGPPDDPNDQQHPDEEPDEWWSSSDHEPRPDPDDKPNKRPPSEARPSEPDDEKKEQSKLLVIVLPAVIGIVVLTAIVICICRVCVRSRTPSYPMLAKAHQHPYIKDTGPAAGTKPVPTMMGTPRYSTSPKAQQPTYDQLKINPGVGGVKDEPPRYTTGPMSRTQSPYEELKLHQTGPPKPVNNPSYGKPDEVSKTGDAAADNVYEEIPTDKGGNPIYQELPDNKT